MSTHIYNWLQRLTLMGLIAAVALVVFPLITSGNTAGDAFLKIDGVAGESRIDVDGDSDSEVTRVRTESRTEHSIEVRCEDGVCEERESSASANICDGYQCPDGSCVSSRDMCIAEVERQREAPSNVVNIQNDPPVASDRTEQRREAGSSGYFEGDQQRSQGAAADSDTNVCDGVTCSDGNCAATPEQCGAVGANYNNSRSNRANIGDLDGDGVGDVQRTQDYNSSRSNKPTRSANNGGDTDGVPTVPADRVRELRANVPELRCGNAQRVRNEGGELYCWGQGVRAAAVGEESDDGTVATSTRVLQYVSVRGDEVRRWSEDERVALARYREQVQDDGSPEMVTASITSLLLDNDRIKTLEVDEVEARVGYRAQLRLFGFIPMEREVIARGTDAEDVTIDYPWYSFLASKPDTDHIRGVFSSLVASIGSGRGGGAGKATFQDVTIASNE